MTITGRTTADENFITVLTTDTIYTIARATGEWGCVKVGQQTATGHTLTPEYLEAWRNELPEKEYSWELKEA